MRLINTRDPENVVLENIVHKLFPGTSLQRVLDVLAFEENNWRAAEILGRDIRPFLIAYLRKHFVRLYQALREEHYNESRSASFTIARAAARSASDRRPVKVRSSSQIRRSVAS